MRLGDALASVFAALVLGKSVDMQQVDSVRLAANATEARFGDLAPPSGAGLDTNIFRHSGPFSQLPHEAASMVSGSTSQSVDNAAFTVVNFIENDATADDLAHFQFAHGMSLDFTNDAIKTNTISGSVVVVTWSITFASNATGFRTIRLQSSEGGNLTLQTCPAVNGGGTTMSGSVVRQITSSDESLWLDVWQNSGGALNVASRFFGVARIR